jgi:hypothetical protein
LANDLASKRAHSNHGVSERAVGRSASMPGTVKREGSGSTRTCPAVMT